MSRVARVLVVEDEAIVLDLLTEFLASQGYEVVGTRGAADAFTMMEVAPPDVLLLDINMPLVDGVTALRRVRALYPEVPVIMVTANVDETVARETLQRGAFDYVLKPFDFAHLIRVVEAAVARGGGGA
ncbi:MAG TPA: response regulator [Candidatus Limnocylindria bacterium]|nr:response regulator [Candidatus Limnocylindria bacterium]